MSHTCLLILNPNVFRGQQKQNVSYCYKTFGGDSKSCWTAVEGVETSGGGTLPTWDSWSSELTMSGLKYLWTGAGLRNYLIAVMTSNGSLHFHLLQIICSWIMEAKGPSLQRHSPAPPGGATRHSRGQGGYIDPSASFWSAPGHKTCPETLQKLCNTTKFKQMFKKNLLNKTKQKNTFFFHFYYFLLISVTFVGFSLMNR